MARTLGLAALVALALAGCTRPLADGERALAREIFGDTLDTDRVRVARGLGLAPLPRPRPERRARVVAPGPRPCAREAPATEPRRELPPAFALGNRVHVAGRFYAADTVAPWPDAVPLPHVLLMAHELVHVWQWQNRAVTGYRPARAFAEGLHRTDPYFYEVTEARPFLSYGYEQQAAIVEDWLCHRLLDPGAEKLPLLEAVIAPVLPIPVDDGSAPAAQARPDRRGRKIFLEKSFAPPAGGRRQNFRRKFCARRNGALGCPGCRVSDELGGEGRPAPTRRRLEGGRHSR